MFKKVIKMNLLGKEALQDLFPGILIFLLIIAGYVNQVNANGEIPIVGAVYFFFHECSGNWGVVSRNRNSILRHFKRDR
jgi:hypothetical protein